jgi:hypothetical protein
LTFTVLVCGSTGLDDVVFRSTLSCWVVVDVVVVIVVVLVVVVVVVS